MVLTSGQQKIEVPFGVFVGQVEDGKPHGQGEINFDETDPQVRIYAMKMKLLNKFTLRK